MRYLWTSRVKGGFALKFESDNTVGVQITSPWTLLLDLRLDLDG